VILHDLRCTTCEAEELDVPIVGGVFPPCDCGGKREWIPRRFATDITGGPFHSTSLDREFDSKSSLRAYLKQNGLQEAGDRVGGARNESHLRLGKSYSYKGQVGRATQAESAGRRGRAGT